MNKSLFLYSLNNDVGFLQNYLSYKLQEAVLKRSTANISKKLEKKSSVFVLNYRHLLRLREELGKGHEWPKVDFDISKEVVV